jgi:hypothetical protein
MSPRAPSRAAVCDAPHCRAPAVADLECWVDGRLVALRAVCLLHAGDDEMRPAALYLERPRP